LCGALTAYCAWRVSEPFDRVGKHIWSLHLTLVCVLAMENHREVEVGMGADLGCVNPQSSYVAMIHNPALLETNIRLGKLQF